MDSIFLLPYRELKNEPRRGLCSSTIGVERAKKGKRREVGEDE